MLSNKQLAGKVDQRWIKVGSSNSRIDSLKKILLPPGFLNMLKQSAGFGLDGRRFALSFVAEQCSGNTLKRKFRLATLVTVYANLYKHSKFE